MLKFKKLNIAKQASKLDADFKRQTSLKPEIDLDKILSSTERKIKKPLENKLSDYLTLLEIGLKLSLNIHTLFQEHHLKTKKAISFVVLSAKIVSLQLGIRKMISSGLLDCTKTLNRTLIETIDIFIGCLGNQELNKSFGNTEEIYDSNKFYFENFSKGKLQKECTKLFKKLNLTQEYIEFLEGRRKEQHTFLSDSIHSSFNSSFANYMMTDFDLKFDNSVFGKITTGYPKTLMQLIEDIYIFNTILLHSLEEKVCSDLEGIELSNCYALYRFYSDKYNILYAENYEKLIEHSEMYSKLIYELWKAV